MEASVAANDGGAAEGAEGAQAPAGGFDLGPVMERFDALDTGLGGRIGAIEQMLTGGDEEQADEGDGEFDLSQLFGAGDEEDAPAGFDPAALQEAFGQYDQRSQEQLQKAIAPLMEQVRNIQVGLDAEALTARYPDLGKPEIAQPVVAAAKELAEALGNPDLAMNTKVLETIYKAQMADRYAAGEKPVGGEQQFELERAGGAGPAAADEPNIAQRIVASRRNDKFW